MPVSTLVRLLAKALALSMILALAALMLGPFQIIEQASKIPDYVGHAVAFFLITICLFILLDGRFLFVTGFLATGLGGAVELIQGRVGRDPSWSDFAADIAGITTALLVLCLFKLLIMAFRAKS